MRVYILKGCQTMQGFDMDQSSKPKGCDYVAAPKITSFLCGLQPLHAEILLMEGF